MRLRPMFLLLVLAILVSGCGRHNPSNATNTNQSEEVYKLTGYVVRNEATRILITSYTPNSKMNNDAVWVITKHKIELGSKVKVEFEGGIETSYPGQGIAKKIDIINEANGSTTSSLSRAHVIANALNKYQNISVPIIKSVEFNSNENNWSVILFDAKSNQPDINFVVQE